MSVRPVPVFVVASLFFGALIVFVTPPLRGPDETAHFLRAYGVARGDIVPSYRDAEGRKGVFLPARIYEGFDFFERVRTQEKPPGFSYGPVFESYFSHRLDTTIPEREPTFVPYAGSEGYSPIAYVPQAAAALLGRALDLDFLPTLYLMRFAGLAVLTVLIAYAIATAPSIAWAVLCVAMLPSAVYGRSVINADGSALAAAMMVTALWLRGILFPQAAVSRQLSLWMIPCALTKPPNVVFALFGLMAPRMRWQGLAMSLPAIALAVLWTISSGADTATWRMVEITGQTLDAFSPVAKLPFVVEHPLHFPTAVLNSLREKDMGELWRQLIGVLGLFDTVLQPWIYPTVSILLIGTFFTKLPIEARSRWHLAAWAGLAMLLYIVAIYLISYLVFTPLSANSVWGVQGRYFVPILPLCALMVAAIANWAPNERLTATLALGAAMLSGGASVEAILRADWL